MAIICNYMSLSKEITTVKSVEGEFLDRPYNKAGYFHIIIMKETYQHKRIPSYEGIKYHGG